MRLEKHQKADLSMIEEGAINCGLSSAYSEKAPLDANCKVMQGCPDSAVTELVKT